MADKFMGVLRPGYSGSEDNMQQNVAEWLNRMGNGGETHDQSQFCLNLGRRRMKIASVGSERGSQTGSNGKSLLKE